MIDIINKIIVELNKIAEKNKIIAKLINIKKSGKIQLGTTISKLCKQSQSHGFKWENSIRVTVFGLDYIRNNTDIHDINYTQNIYNSNENISIKTTGTGMICCSDILRFYQYDFSKKNTLLIIKYIQEIYHKRITCIYTINYNKEMHKYLFGDISISILKEYIDYIKKIPNGIVDKTIKKKYKIKKEELQQKYNMNIIINPKVDSKYQRRVQCSVNDFEKKLYKFIEHISEKNKPNYIRGIEIPLKIKSTTRKRYHQLIPIK